MSLEIIMNNYASKFDNLEEMDKLLYTCTLEMENLNRPIIIMRLNYY